MENKKLEVGDVVYSYNQYGVRKKYVIESVTDTQAICGTTKFRRELKLGHTELVEAGIAFVSIQYSIETPTLKQAYEMEQYLKKILRFDYVKLRFIDAKAIVEILKKYK